MKVGGKVKGQALPVIQSIPEGAYCDNCSYQPTGIRRVLPDGSGDNGVMLVGDSPWEKEVAAGRNFHGPSGQWLDNILTKRGLDRSSFIVTNGGTWCKPISLGHNDEPEKYYDAQMAMRQCRPYLDNLIAERQPKVLVALGNVALKRLTGFENVESNNGYVIQSDYNIPVVPTFHPSGIIQGNWNLTIAFILSIARAMEIAAGTFEATPVKVVEDPDPSYIQYPGNGDITIPVMCDIETPKSLAGRNEEEAEDDPSYQIIRMGFSVNAWQGVSFPFDGDYIRRAKELVARARTLIFWNKNYDIPRLKAAGFNFHPQLTVIDAMWAWHWLYSDLPKALAFAAPFFYAGAPWKHLASQRPAYYSAMDNAIQMGVYEGVKKQLEADNRWDRFWNHCVRVDPIYVRMGQAGVKVDKAARATFMEALKQDAKVELVKIQSLLPPRLVRYKESFKELKPLKVEGVKPTRAIYNSLITLEKVEVPATTKSGDTIPTEGGGILMRPLWRRSIPFNPWAREDLLDLMRELKVKIPKARGEDRESAESKYLKRITKYPIFRHCVSYKQRTKLISTYDWPLDSNNRAHSTYGYGPSTWRSNSRNVNLGNIPKRFELAKLFRRLLIAERGCKLIEIDRSAIEAVLVGYWAKSPAYINLAKAGVHSYMCAHVIGEHVSIDTPFAELKAILKAIKKKVPIETYEGMKRVVHGCVTGDHEVLTKRGWVLFSSYQGNEPIAIWDNGSISFETPRRLVRELHQGNMVEVSGVAVNSLMTTNHKLPVFLSHPSKPKSRFKPIEASNLRRGFIPIGGDFTTGANRYTLQAVRLAVAIQADGSMVGNQIRFDLSMPKKVERLRLLLEGIPHRSYPSSRGTIRTIINCSDIPDSLEICTSEYKIFAFDTVINLSVREAEAFLDELPLWDGSVGKTKLYYTTVKHNAEVVQALAHIHNRMALLRERPPKAQNHKLLYVVSFSNRRWATVGNLKKRSVDSFNGPIFCVTVSSGYFMVRHKGRVFVTGNSNYLLSAYGIHDEYEEFFKTEYDAQKAQDMYLNSDAGMAVRAYHKATIEEAYSHKYLDNSFQYRHYFWGPMYKYSKREKRWIVDHEGDAKRAVAFRPQSDGAAIQREDILALEPVDWFSKLLRLPTYDSLVAECPIDYVDRSIELLAGQFDKPIGELGGLEGFDGRIGFEIKVGDNLAPKDESNPDGMQEISL